MRTLFWLLLLADIILFVLIQQGWMWQGEQGMQMQPALHEDKIRLLKESITPIAMTATPAPTPAPITITAPPAKPPAALNISAPVATQSNGLAKTQTCLEWGDFSGTNLKLAEISLTGLQLGGALDKRQLEQVIGYWVYIPPLGSKAAINQKVGQLKARGIDEYFIVQEAGQWRNAISLGVFKTEEAAQSFLAFLRTKDVRSARVGERSSKLKMTTFLLRGASHEAEAKLVSLQKDFPGSELRNVPCAH